MKTDILPEVKNRLLSEKTGASERRVLLKLYGLLAYERGEDTPLWQKDFSETCLAKHWGDQIPHCMRIEDWEDVSSLRQTLMDSGLIDEDKTLRVPRLSESLFSLAA